MQQVKIFEGNGNNESDINAWLKECQDVKIINITMVPMFDRYSYGQGEICNQWVSTIVLYNEDRAERLKNLPPLNVIMAELAKREIGKEGE